MKRRDFVKAAAGGVAVGPLAQVAASTAAPGRQFKPSPPLAMPARRRLIDLHVHPSFTQERSTQPEFPVFSGNSSRPDGVSQTNISWEQFALTWIRSRRQSFFTSLKTKGERETMPGVFFGANSPRTLILAEKK